MEAANAARAARAAVEAAAAAVKAAETLVATDHEAEAAKETREEGAEVDYDSGDEYRRSLAEKASLHVPVEGAIHVRTASGATKEELQEGPKTECHTLAVPNYSTP